MRAAFRVLAAAFVCAAAYHVFAIVGGDTDARARHATFALIDLFVGVLMIRRPPGFAIAFALLCGQQLASHGADLVRSLRGERVDWISLVVVVAMPLVLVLLLVDARSRRARS
jgi:hypothetical protein